jgi:hypothetical protein
MAGGFEAVLAGSSKQVQDLARRTRALINEVYPGVVEVPWPRQKTVGYGVGPRKQTEHFCSIALQRDHVDLGFNYGAELPDPDGLLEGTGALMRHVTISTPEDLERPALRALLEAASTHRMPGGQNAPLTRQQTQV